ncbi:hypothetical protein K437DRAFT_48374, partial [Tilletiaria anomala UBC 951]
MTHPDTMASAHLPPLPPLPTTSDGSAVGAASSESAASSALQTALLDRRSGYGNVHGHSASGSGSRSSSSSGPRAAAASSFKASVLQLDLRRSGSREHSDSSSLATEFGSLFSAEQQQQRHGVDFSLSRGARELATLPGDTSHISVPPLRNPFSSRPGTISVSSDSPESSLRQRPPRSMLPRQLAPPSSPLPDVPSSSPEPEPSPAPCPGESSSSSPSLSMSSQFDAVLLDGPLARSLQGASAAAVTNIDGMAGNVVLGGGVGVLDLCASVERAAQVAANDSLPPPSSQQQVRSTTPTRTQSLRRSESHSSSTTPDSPSNQTSFKQAAQNLQQQHQSQQAQQQQSSSPSLHAAPISLAHTRHQTRASIDSSSSTSVRWRSLAFLASAISLGSYSSDCLHTTSGAGGGSGGVAPESSSRTTVPSGGGSRLSLDGPSSPRSSGRSGSGHTASSFPSSAAARASSGSSRCSSDAIAPSSSPRHSSSEDARRAQTRQADGLGGAATEAVPAAAGFQQVPIGVDGQAQAPVPSGIPVALPKIIHATTQAYMVSDDRIRPEALASPFIPSAVTAAAVESEARAHESKVKRSLGLARSGSLGGGRKSEPRKTRSHTNLRQQVQAAGVSSADDAEMHSPPIHSPPMHSP